MASRARRLRSQAKVTLAAAIAGARRVPFLSTTARTRGQALVLGYHRVVPDFAEEARTSLPSMLISRAMFEHHLELLAREFRFVGLDEIGEHAASGEPFDGPVAAVTFDDGYRDVYENAFPVLKRMGIPAAVFVVTDLVGRAGWQAHDRLYHLLATAHEQWADPRRELMGLLRRLDLPGSDGLGPRAATRTPSATVSTLLPWMSQDAVIRLMTGLEAAVGNGVCDGPPSLTWSMVAEMHRAGITIGSHTRTHVSLPCETPASARAQLEESKRDLEGRLGEPVRHFAYPGGQFTPSVVEATARAGYAFAYTACPHGDPRYRTLTIPRLLLWEGSSTDAAGRFAPAMLSCQAHDLWLPARRCERSHRE